MKDIFRKIANKVSAWTGSAPAFLGAVLIVAVWAATGPTFHYSNTWQLIINTGTTIGTFLMVFLIQNTQNRDGKAMQLKLDELIRSGKGRNSFVDLEDLTDDDLAKLDQEFKLLHEKQLASASMHKLHEKIAEEHKRRSALHEAGHVLDKLNPLSFGNRDKK